jgi:hypothetical protein
MIDDAVEKSQNHDLCMYVLQRLASACIEMTIPKASNRHPRLPHTTLYWKTRRTFVVYFYLFLRNMCPKLYHMGAGGKVTLIVCYVP